MRLSEGRPVVLESAAGHGVYHRLNAERYTTHCGYRVRCDDFFGTKDLPECAACAEQTRAS